MDGLTEQELRWVTLTLKSTEAVRMQLLAGETPDAKALYDLCNRAETLIWHLAKRDTLPEPIKQALGL